MDILQPNTRLVCSRTIIPKNTYILQFAMLQQKHKSILQCKEISGPQNGQPESFSIIHLSTMSFCLPRYCDLLSFGITPRSSLITSVWPVPVLDTPSRLRVVVDILHFGGLFCGRTSCFRLRDTKLFSPELLIRY